MNSNMLSTDRPDRRPRTDARGPITTGPGRETTHDGMVRGDSARSYDPPTLELLVRLNLAVATRD